LADEAGIGLTEVLKIMVQETVFAEFEKSELQKSDIPNMLRDVSSILGNVLNNEFLTELSDAGDEVIGERHQNFEKNKIFLNSLQQKLSTLDEEQIMQVLNIYYQRGMWDAINYIRNHY
jgi:hypothetical protein